MTKKQRKWLESYNRENYSLSTYKARNCGYGDLLKAGYIANRGPPLMPNLFITPDGIMALRAI